MGATVHHPQPEHGRPTSNSLAPALILDVPPMPLVVREGVFDAWSWCKSDVLEWRRPVGSSASAFASTSSTALGQNPADLVFVMRVACASPPREPARLHAFGYGLDAELALAPYAIDDATDLLYEHEIRPANVFWLAAGTLDALVWGLHDWVHFHNHGPFDEPAMTELQCDLVALAWLRRNAARIALTEAALDDVARSLATLSRKRFADEDVASPVADLDALFLGPYPSRL